VCVCVCVVWGAQKCGGITLWFSLFMLRLQIEQTDVTNGDILFHKHLIITSELLKNIIISVLSAYLHLNMHICEIYSPGHFLPS